MTPNKTTTSESSAQIKKGITTSSQNQSTTDSKSSSTSLSQQSGSKNQGSLKMLFETELRDMYSAEQQLIKALPKVAEAAFDEELQDAFNEHLEQTKRQAERLEKIFSRLRIEKEGEKCEAMEGLIKECDEVIEKFEQGPVRDSALIIGAQKIEHYEIASYGSLCELAEVLGLYKIADVLDRSLAEEEETDHLLTDIAMDINDEALEVSMDEEREA